jgi:hypothetical protein
MYLKEFLIGFEGNLIGFKGIFNWILDVFKGI